MREADGEQPRPWACDSHLNAEQTEAGGNVRASHRPARKNPRTPIGGPHERLAGGGSHPSRPWGLGAASAPPRQAQHAKPNDLQMNEREML